MQFCACKFRPEDSRSYTYRWEGEEPLAVGDEVRVPDRSGDGWKRVEIVSITDEEPAFPTKPILGLYEPPPEDETDAENSDQPSNDADGALPF